MVLRILVALALLCSVAGAEDKPWAKGVSAQKQKLALQQFEVANRLFVEGKYVDALPEYDAALSLWDHPAIHFNYAVCLINLARLVEAYGHMQQAMAYGNAPLGAKLHAEGLVHITNLNGKVGTLEIKVKQDGVTVMLDGKQVIGPGQSSARVNVLATEEHQIVAEKDPHYETATQTIKPAPGKVTTVELVVKQKSRGKLVRRWAKWKPWAVMSVGGAIAIGGGFIHWSATNQFKEFDTAFQGVCPMGCTERALEMDHQSIVNMRKSGELRQTVAVSAYVVGGATAAVSLAMVVLNQPRLVKPVIAPMPGADRGGAVISVRW